MKFPCALAIFFSCWVPSVSGASRQHNIVQDYLSSRQAIVDEMMGADIRNTLNIDKSDVKLGGAISDFNVENEQAGEAAWIFLKLLASSPLFVSQFWQSQPLLLRSKEIEEILSQNMKGNIINWVDSSFTVENDLKLLDGSYISGSRTDDVLRQGIKTDSWAFRPIKDNPARPTTWKEVDDALKGGTIYFNSAGGFWPNLGALCRLTSYAFGLPTNINIYITPPKSPISVPPHTDRQDVIVFQTEGSKRWKVYGPPKRQKGKDPLNRGKSGDVITKNELGAPILDVILRRGDIMYVPAGFPHTTDTVTIVEKETVPSLQESSDKKEFDETSVHLTMGLDTHVWALTFAHIRWTLLQRCGKDWKVDIKDDKDYWNTMRTIPVGFLSLLDGDDENAMDIAVEEVKRILIRLESKRWKKEDLPSNEEIKDVLHYMIDDHLATLLEIQENMYTNIKPREEETLIKSYECTQKQDQVMQKYGAFSNNEAMKAAFEQRRLEREKKASDAANREL